MIPVPSLDTVDFDALVEEGRALIPRYAPDWTDHNLHDPGITLLELLAWLVDQQVYRIGFVGEAHLRAFAALLGVKPERARAASGLLWPAADFIPGEQPLPAGTRAWPAHQPELIFTTVAPVRLSQAAIEGRTSSTAGRMARVRPDSSGVLRLLRDTETLQLDFNKPLFADFEAKSTLSLGLEFDRPLPDLGPGNSIPIRFDYRTGDGAWHRAPSYWIGGGARRSGAALLDIAQGHGGVAAIRLGLTGFPVRALPTRIALNVLPIEQIETLPEAKLGDAPGLPDLEISLGAGSTPETAHNPLKIHTFEQGGRVEWHRTDDLAGSGPDDNDYVLDEARSTIRFGNGVNGRMPPASHEVQRAALDVTAGERGNLISGLDWRVEGFPGAIDSWSNREPMSGGRDSWDREQLLTELRQRSRSRSAMLSDTDLRDAATRLLGFGVERAEILARFLPTVPDRPVPGARTLLLHPADGVQGSDEWVDAIERRLAPRRVLGERLVLTATEPVTISVSAELLIAAGSDALSIQKTARSLLEARLSSFRKSAEIDPWPSGRAVTSSELETLLAKVEGVVAIPRLHVGSRSRPPKQLAEPLARTEVAVAGAIDIELRVED